MRTFEVFDAATSDAHEYIEFRTGFANFAAARWSAPEFTRVFSRLYLVTVSAVGSNPPGVPLLAAFMVFLHNRLRQWNCVICDILSPWGRC